MLSCEDCTRTRKNGSLITALRTSSILVFHMSKMNRRMQTTTTTVRWLLLMRKTLKITWIELRDDSINFMNPFLALDNPSALAKRLYEELGEYYDLTKSEVKYAVEAAYKEAESVKGRCPEKRGRSSGMACGNWQHRYRSLWTSITTLIPRSTTVFRN